MTEAKFKKMQSLIKTINQTSNLKELEAAEGKLRDVQQKIVGIR